MGQGEGNLVKNLRQRYAFGVALLTRLFKEHKMTQLVNNAIDTIAGAKKTFVTTFVPNEELRKPLNTFIDAQTDFAKKVVTEVNSFFTTVSLAAFSIDAKKAFPTK